MIPSTSYRTLYHSGSLFRVVFLLFALLSSIECSQLEVACILVTRIPSTILLIDGSAVERWFLPVFWKGILVWLLYLPDRWWLLFVFYWYFWAFYLSCRFCQGFFHFYPNLPLLWNGKLKSFKIFFPSSNRWSALSTLFKGLSSSSGWLLIL